MRNLDGYWANNPFGQTDSSGNAYLWLEPGTYNISAYSLNEHFGLYQLDVSSPSTITLSAVGTPAITLTAMKRDGTPLDHAFAMAALSSGSLYSVFDLGSADTYGHMIFHVTPGTYDFNVADLENKYDLLVRQQTISGTVGTLDFDMSVNPSAAIVINNPGGITTRLFLYLSQSRISTRYYFYNVAEGSAFILSANEVYKAAQVIQKDVADGDHWQYVLEENRPDGPFAPGEVFTFTVGGLLTVTGRTTPAFVGEYITVTNGPLDDYGNLLTSIYTTTASGFRNFSIFPLNTITDPVGHGSSFWWNGHQIPYTATTGLYTMHHEWDSGPYQGLLAADSTFEVKPIASSATIPINGGVLTSTFDSTAYSFGEGTFTDTVVVTHTVRFANIPPFGELAGIGHTFDITGVYSSTGLSVQPSEPYMIIIKYSNSELGYVNEHTLALYFWDGNQWIKEPSSLVDIQNNILLATPDHFSIWAILGEKLIVLYLPFILK